MAKMGNLDMSDVVATRCTFCFALICRLQLTEDEVRREFEEFYDDVLPEFEAHGTVTNLKVSCSPAFK